MRDFAVDGDWGDWSAWSDCDCVTQLVTRTRFCDNPTPQGWGSDCVGPDVEDQPAACSCGM